MLVIDCHGHYTTAPERHQTYRQDLLAAFKDPSLPAPEIQEFCDDEIRETIENGQLNLQRQRSADLICRSR